MKNIQRMFKTKGIRENSSQEKEEHGSTRKKKTTKENEKRKIQKENQFGLQLATPSDVRTRQKPRMRAGTIKEPEQGRRSNTLDNNCNNSFLA